MHELRKAAHEHPQQENRVAEEQTWFAAEDVANLPYKGWLKAVARKYAVHNP